MNFEIEKEGVLGFKYDVSYNFNVLTNRFFRVSYLNPELHDFKVSLSSIHPDIVLKTKPGWIEISGYFDCDLFPNCEIEYLLGKERKKVYSRTCLPSSPDLILISYVPDPNQVKMVDVKLSWNGQTKTLSRIRVLHNKTASFNKVIAQIKGNPINVSECGY